MKKEVFAYLHSHWDREWYKTFEEYRFRLVQVMEDIFCKLENNEINCFYLDGQTTALDDYLEICPQKLELVKNLIKKKKLFVGPFYDLSDEFLVTGESLFRNLLIGIKEAKEYGADEQDFIGYLPDAFGHCSYMPAILKKANIQNAIVWRGVGNAKQEFFWRAPDGTKIKTAYLANGYYQDFFAQKSYTKNVNKLLGNLLKYNDAIIPVILPIGADHLACEDKIKSKIKNFNRNNKNFSIKLSSPVEYFKATQNNTELTTIDGELRNNFNNYVLPSVLSSRVYLKQKNMYLQWLLGKIAEPVYAICTNNNLLEKKKDIIDYIWKLLIQNHAHDSICGCSLDSVHKDNMNRFERVEQLCNSLLDFANYKLAKKISKNEIGIFNLSNYAFSGVFSFYSDKKLPLPKCSKKKMFPIEISQDIHNIPVQENYKYYYQYLCYAENLNELSFSILKPEFNESLYLSATNTTLENEYLKVCINKNGTLNLTNKINNQQINNLFKITDEADVGDSYNFSCILNDEKLTAEYKNSKLIENNPLRKVLRLFYELKIPTHAKNNTQRSSKTAKHIFVADLILTAAAKRLDIKINYKNLSKDHILKLNFALPNTIDKVICEDTFGTIERSYKPNYDYKKHLPLNKYEEIDLNTNPLQRFVMTQGLCVLTKGLQEYEVYKNDLNITMLRCFDRIARKELLTRTAAAGPPLPTPEAQCLGEQSAEIALLLTNNPYDAMKEADFFYNPLFVIDGKSKQTQIKDSQWLKVPENFYIYNIKYPENSEGLIIKIFNNSISEEKLLFENKKIAEVNLLEENTSDIIYNNKPISFKPFELKILKIAPNQ